MPVWDAMDKDESGNVASGRVLFEGGRPATYARSEGGRLVACVGTTNLIVVEETDDAVLVADRSCVQDIKGLVSRIKKQKSPRSRYAQKGSPAPWGILRLH